MTFDLVCCIEVLEHLGRPTQAMSELIRLKSPRGKLFLTVPDGRQDTWKGYVNFWSVESFHNFFSEFGEFEVCLREPGAYLLAREL